MHRRDGSATRLYPQYMVYLNQELVLHLENGIELEVHIQDDRVILARPNAAIESAFGIVKAETTASLEDMERAIRTR